MGRGSTAALIPGPIGANTISKGDNGRMKAPGGRHGDFDEWSHNYDQSLLHKVLFDPVHRTVVGAMGTLLRGVPIPRIVDVGCGTGRLLIRLRDQFPYAELHGVDPSAGMIEVARNKADLEGIRIDHGSAEALPFESSSFDAVVSTMSFHHWDDQAAGLAEIGRILRPGRPLILVDVLSDGPFRGLVNRFGRGHGLGFRSRDELDDLLRGAGLRMVASRAVGSGVLPVQIIVTQSG
jgi:ubiquinone/menaquinone biosynthesis C-methylase UbiE